MSGWVGKVVNGLRIRTSRCDMAPTSSQGRWERLRKAPTRSAKRNQPRVRGS